MKAEEGVHADAEEGRVHVGVEEVEECSWARKRARGNTWARKRVWGVGVHGDEGVGA